MANRIYLEGFSGKNKLPRRYDIDAYPVVIGRHEDCNLQLNIPRISRHHAEIDQVEGGLQIKDLGSTNGTFVNHKRIDKPAGIGNGDVLHLADHEFRLVCEAEDSTQVSQSADSTIIGIQSLPSHFPTQVREFETLLKKGLVRAFHQVIRTITVPPMRPNCSAVATTRP